MGKPSRPTSSYPTPDYPTPGYPTPSYPARLLALLDGSAGLDRDRPVFEHGPRVVTAAEMLDLVARIAAGLRTAGITSGAGVALALGVTPEAFAATVAAHVVGARVVGVRPGLPPAQLVHLIDPDLAAVLVDGSTPAAVRDVAGGLPLLAIGPLDGLTDLVATRAGTGPPECTARPDDVARIIYTSGSTGIPKGCVQTYRALAAGWTPDPTAWPPVIRELAARLDRYLVFGSLSSYVMAEYGVLTLAAGGTMVVADPPSFPGAFADLRAGASVITVARLYRMVAAQRAAPVELGTLRALMVSGSPLDPGRLAEAIDVLGPVVFHGYGQTETGMISMIGPAGMLAGPAALASVGAPPDAVQVQVRGPDGLPVPDGEAGEVFVRTPVQADGYWRDPVETAEVFVAGWVRTRDRARRDSAGRIDLLGRTRDVIIVNAELVHPGPVERALARHPDVAEAYVVGTPSEQTGEAIHAFVVPRDGRAADPGTLRALVAAELGSSAVPATLTTLDEVPLTPAGKPDRQLMRRMVLATADGGRI